MFFCFGLKLFSLLLILIVHLLYKTTQDLENFIKSDQKFLKARIFENICR